MMVAEVRLALRAAARQIHGRSPGPRPDPPALPPAAARPAGRPRRERPPLTAEQADLAARYLPLARSIAKPFRDVFYHHAADFDSAAGLAICEAAQAFDPSKGILFSTFARHRVRGAMLDVQRLALPFGYRADHEGAPGIWPLFTRSENAGRVLIQSHPTPAEEAASRDAFERQMRKLPPKHAAACRRIYVHGERQGRAARAVGCSQSRLSVLHREALVMLGGARRSADRPDESMKESA
jgi:RNA polymerase sigma factor (sigma-70 family)